MANPTKHTGSCHCGAVRFEVEVDATSAGRCNCSICTKLGATSAIAGPDALTVLAGEEVLTGYQWGPRISRRYFCSRCGVLCFARGNLPELGGDYVSVSVGALDDVDLAEVAVHYWDGRNDNWEAGPSSRPWPVQAAAAAV